MCLTGAKGVNPCPNMGGGGNIGVKYCGMYCAAPHLASRGAKQGGGLGVATPLNFGGGGSTPPDFERTCCLIAYTYRTFFNCLA